LLLDVGGPEKEARVVGYPQGEAARAGEAALMSVKARGGSPAPPSSGPAPGGAPHEQAAAAMRAARITWRG
jgi:hypothetical protein